MKVRESFPELRAYLRNQNIVLYYKLKHRIGKKWALRIAYALCLLLNEKGGSR